MSASHSPQAFEDRLAGQQMSELFRLVADDGWRRVADGEVVAGYLNGAEAGVVRPAAGRDAEPGAGSGPLIPGHQTNAVRARDYLVGERASYGWGDS